MSKPDEDRAAAEARAAEVRAKIAEGQRIAQILAERQAAKSRALLEKALKQDKKDRK